MLGDASFEVRIVGEWREAIDHRQKTSMVGSRPARRGR